MNVQTNIEHDERLIFQSFNFRVKICSTNWQWIIQKRQIVGTEYQWRPLSYHRTKESLVRVYAEKTGDTLGASVLNKMLPSQFGGADG